MRLGNSVLVGGLALVAACTGGGSSAGPGRDSGGSGGAAPEAGGPMSGTGGAGTGGASGSGGAVVGSSGSGGQSTDGGGAGAGDDALATDAGPKFTKQWSCPPGPFPNDSIGARKAVCAGFAYRYNYVEGPTWLPSQRAFYFSNFNVGNGHFGDIIKYTPSTGICETFLEGVGCNGLAVHANGKLLGACHLTHSITEFDPVTKTKRVIADSYMGQTLNSPNDLIAHSSGSIFFSNPVWESIVPLAGSIGPAVFWIDPTEVVHPPLATGGFPNGVALSPDEKTLYVVGAGTWMIDASGAPILDSHQGNGPGGDGLSVNCGGQIFAPTTNSCFGGEDGKTMFIVSGIGGNLHAETVQMMVPGIP